MLLQAGGCNAFIQLLRNDIAFRFKTRVDYVFASPNFYKMAQYEVIRNNASDHSVVVIDFELK